MREMELWEYIAYRKRQDKSLRRSDIAKHLGVNRSVLSQIEHYKVVPSVRLAKKIEAFSEGSVCWWKLIEKCWKNG